MDAILGAAILRFKADDHALNDPRMVLRERAQSLEMIRCNFGRGLGLDGDLHVIDDKIHLNPASQAPVAQGGETLRIGVVRTQFVENPVFEGLAVKLGAWS